MDIEKKRYILSLGRYYDKDHKHFMSKEVIDRFSQAPSIWKVVGVEFNTDTQEYDVIFEECWSYDDL